MSGSWIGGDPQPPWLYKKDPRETEHRHYQLMPVSVAYIRYPEDGRWGYLHPPRKLRGSLWRILCKIHSTEKPDFYVYARDATMAERIARKLIGRVDGIESIDS